jgi:hypothetical protein
MLRRLASIITIVVLTIFPLIFATSSYAAGSIDDIGKNDMDKYLQDFCAKRQGGQMNLETWYSGKCPTDKDKFDTFSGEGVGFSDIIILDLAEKLSGKKDPNQTFLKTIENAFNAIKALSLNATPEEKQLAISSARQQIFSSQQGGIVSDSGKMIGFLFQGQPASTYSYLAYVSQNLQKHRIIPEALAAPATSGVGFSTFSSFLPLWTAMRNIAYLGLVVFFVVYGFMMMFRVNLGQKTVITVQLAIPKLIITLLMITFSYAIVGFMIDIMWVLVYFFLNLLKTQGLIKQATVLGIDWFPGRIISGERGIIGSFIWNSFVAVPAAIYGTISLIIGGSGVATSLVSYISTIALGVSPIGLIIGIIIIIAVLVSYVKLFFKLIGALISIIISLITAPLVLLGNAFPGSSAIGNWLRGLMANISVFPITML